MYLDTSFSDSVSSITIGNQAINLISRGSTIYYTAGEMQKIAVELCCHLVDVLELILIKHRI